MLTILEQIGLVAIGLLIVIVVGAFANDQDSVGAYLIGVFVGLVYASIVTAIIIVRLWGVLS